MTDDNEEDTLRFARCPRCGVFDPRRVDDDPEGPCRPNFAIQDCRVCGLGGVSRSPIRGGYWKSDLLEIVDDPPMMGKPCLHCGSRIPKFLDLEDDEKTRIYRLMRSDRRDDAVDALVAATGCPISWAKIWVAHPFGPRRPIPRWAGPPCSYCGQPLRTMLARRWPVNVSSAAWTGTNRTTSTGSSDRARPARLGARSSKPSWKLGAGSWKHEVTAEVILPLGFPLTP